MHPQDTNGRKTILVVDDEPSVRKVLRLALARLGFRILEAGNATAAIAQAAKNGPHIDLLVTDIVMPGQNGYELAESLKAEHPEMRVLYISGCADVDAVVPLLSSTAGFIEKPFRLDIIVDAVQRMLPPHPDCPCVQTFHSVVISASA